MQLYAFRSGGTALSSVDVSHRVADTESKLLWLGSGSRSGLRFLVCGDMPLCICASGYICNASVSTAAACPANNCIVVFQHLTAYRMLDILWKRDCAGYYMFLIHGTRAL